MEESSSLFAGPAPNVCEAQSKSKGGSTYNIYLDI